MSSVPPLGTAGRYKAPLCGRTVSQCAFAKSLPRMPSSSPISVTMKSQSTVRAPRVTASLARPMHSSACPSTEHSRPQYFRRSFSGRLHLLQTRAARINTTDPVLTKKLTMLPPTHPGRYSPFPTACVPSFIARPRALHLL